MTLKLIETNCDEELEIILERSMTLADFRRELRGTLVVKFIKKSTGKVRYLFCTRNMDIVTKLGGELPKGVGYNGPPEVIPVWDLVKRKWRSFDVRTVRDVTKRDLTNLDRFSKKSQYKDDFAKKRAFGLLGRRDADNISYVEDQYIPPAERISECFALDVTRNEKLKGFKTFDV
jgi:hypothetical protein